MNGHQVPEVPNKQGVAVPREQKVQVPNRGESERVWVPRVMVLEMASLPGAEKVSMAPV